MNVGAVHLMYGLAGSGKITRARELADDKRAVLFTLDEWMIRLFPNLAFDAPDYGERAQAVKDLIWSTAEQILVTGTDVVFDWNSWSRARRSWAVQRARSVGADVMVHCVLGTAAEASQRVEQRTARGAKYAHPVTNEGNVHLATLMESPNPSEGLRVIGDPG